MYYTRNGDHAREGVTAACELTLKNLRLDYLDLYLIHWPLPLKNGVKIADLTNDDKLGYTSEAMAETWKVCSQPLITHLEPGCSCRLFNASNSVV